MIVMRGLIFGLALMCAGAAWAEGTVGDIATAERSGLNAVGSDKLASLLDIDALRDTRRKTGMTNTLSRLPNAAFASAYGQANHAPANRTPDAQMIERKDAIAQQQAVIDRLVESGVLK